MKVAVYGGGYVGLVTAAGFASCGHSAAVIEADPEKLVLLKRGKAPFFEPHLEDLLADAYSKARLEFFSPGESSLRAVLSKADAIFIAVGTPESKSGATDMKAVKSVVDHLKSFPIQGKIVVMKSTVPVGTCDWIESEFKKSKLKVRVVSNPEFLKQGNAVTDFTRPERVIVGTEDPKARLVMSSLYKPFMLKSDRLIFMDRRSSELVKYACNAFLATKISFINEMALLAEKVGANIRSIREGMISDSRIGSQFLFPGVGFGGSCFPKDLRSLVWQGEAVGFDLHLPKAAWQVNRRQKLWAYDTLMSVFRKKLKGKRVALWGLTFKPNTDDLREAPSGDVLALLIKAGAKVVAYDPVGIPNASKEWASFIKSGGLILADSPYDVFKNADAFILMTEWAEFRAPDFKKIRKLMRGDKVLDGRNILDLHEAKHAGLQYWGVGQSRKDR